MAATNIMKLPAIVFNLTDNVANGNWHATRLPFGPGISRVYLSKPKGSIFPFAATSSSCACKTCWWRGLESLTQCWSMDGYRPISVRCQGVNSYHRYTYTKRLSPNAKAKAFAPALETLKLLRLNYWRYCWMRVVRRPARPCFSIERCQPRYSSTVSV